MSGGAAGLGGYVYQQDYLAYRVMASVCGKDVSMAPLYHHSSHSRLKVEPLNQARDGISFWAAVPGVSNFSNVRTPRSRRTTEPSSTNV